MSSTRKISTNPLTGSACLNALPPLDLSNLTREDIKTYFNNSFDLYETLFSSIKTDAAYYTCPDRLRLPLVFYYGHTAAVFVNKLCISGLIHPSERINSEFETTLETGVDEMSWDDTEHYRMGGSYRWPTIEQIREYRLEVRQLINKVIDRLPLELPIVWDSPWWTIFIGIEHEKIHFETSTVLIRQYPLDMVVKPSAWVYGPAKLQKSETTLGNPMIIVPATQVRLGKPLDYPSHSWDNEYGQVDCKVSAFEASKFKVTNEQFLEFVESGGYEKREYWSNEGWQWVQFKQAKHPLFWICPLGCKSGCGGQLASVTHCQQHYFGVEQLRYFAEKPAQQTIAATGSDDDHAGSRQSPPSSRYSMSKKKEDFAFVRNLDENGNERDEGDEGTQTRLLFPYKYRLMFNVTPMPVNWPVECNYHEAKAFCKWRGADYRILTEAEHHAIRDTESFELSCDNDIAFQPSERANLNMSYGSSTPVNMYKPNSKGFHDVFGSVWEWCEDNFNGLCERTHYVYDDFSSPCYDGRHNMIMGSSWASCGMEASRFARFMFRRHFYQHSGFRLARSLSTDDGSKPNPQVRLVKDRIYVLGSGFPDNQTDLDGDQFVLDYYDTTNKQYWYDSHLHVDLFESELVDEFAGDWHEPLMRFVSEQLALNNVQRRLATVIGAGGGRATFELVERHFDELVGVDFCGKLVDVALKLQQHGSLNIELTTTTNQSQQQQQPTLSIDLRQNEHLSKATFKQMTWIPNEILKSDFVLFNMIDRVNNPLSWLRRFREIVKSDGLLIVHSKTAMFDSKYLKVHLKEFDLLLETSVTTQGKNTVTVWKHKLLCTN